MSNLRVSAAPAQAKQVKLEPATMKQPILVRQPAGASDPAMMPSPMSSGRAPKGPVLISLHILDICSDLIRYCILFHMVSRTYGNLIWTNHALERLEQRRFSQELAWSAFRYPDAVVKGKAPDSYEYQKRYQNSLITLIAKQNEHRQWVVLSCWIDPPLPGTRDAREHQLWKKSQTASGWGKWWITFRRILGW